QGSDIWVGVNAAGYGWFIDPTPSSDSEFTTPGNQGEQGHMDLLTVLAHELGHVLGFTEQDEGVMGEYLPTGTREMPAAVNLSISQQFQSQETVNSSSSFGPAIVSNGEMFSATPAGSKPVKTASANKPIIQPIRTIVIDAINLWAAAGRDVSLPTMV